MPDTSLVVGSLVFGDKVLELRVSSAPVMGREVSFSPEVSAIAERITSHFKQVPHGASYEISSKDVVDICRALNAMLVAK